jgi:prepilin-type N-terminal cleavage/methylation domain-containing protein
MGLNDGIRQGFGAQGYTLVEILVTAALISVLAGITVPAITAGLDRYAMISASQQVVSTIRAARIQAVAKNRRHFVRFDADAGEYQIRRLQDDGVTEEDGGSVLYLPDGVSFSDPTDVEFTTSGRAVAAVSIVVADDDGDLDQTITVATSGQVRLE